MALPTLLEAVEALPAFTRLAGALPAARHAVTVGGLHGSSSAVLLAALARRFPQRLFVVLTAGVPEAERWLADLQTLLEAPAEGGAPVALYPPREAFGEAEPHEGQPQDDPPAMFRSSLRTRGTHCGPPHDRSKANERTTCAQTSQATQRHAP